VPAYINSGIRNQLATEKLKTEKLTTEN